MTPSAAEAHRKAFIHSPREFRQSYFEIMDDLRVFVGGRGTRKWGKEHRLMLDEIKFITPFDPDDPGGPKERGAP